MKQISQKYFYDSDFLDPKIPNGEKFIPKTLEKELPILILDNLLSPKTCDKMVAKLRASIGGKVEIDDEQKLNTNIRDTFFLNITPGDHQIIKSTVENTRPQIEKYFDAKLEESEGLQILGYGEGGKYQLHSDSCNPFFDDKGTFDHWELTRGNRQISLILFLSDSVSVIKYDNEFVGGTVSFDYMVNGQGKCLVVQPKKGTLVAFPSNPYFSHTVHEVYEGFRVSVVEWYKAKIKIGK